MKYLFIILMLVCLAYPNKLLYGVAGGALGYAVGHASSESSMPVESQISATGDPEIDVLILDFETEYDAKTYDLSTGKIRTRWSEPGGSCNGPKEHNEWYTITEYINKQYPGINLISYELIKKDFQHNNRVKTKVSIIIKSRRG